MSLIGFWEKRISLACADGRDMQIGAGQSHASSDLQALTHQLPDLLKLFFR